MKIAKSNELPEEIDHVEYGPDGMVVPSRAGDLLIMFNGLHDGKRIALSEPNPRTLHASCGVTNVGKWLQTQWVTDLALEAHCSGAYLQQTIDTEKFRDAIRRKEQLRREYASGAFD